MTKRAARPGHVGRVREGEPDPPEMMAARFRALGPGGPAALAALWKRPRLRSFAWTILDAIDHARARLARGAREYTADVAARDLERKMRLPRVRVLDMTEPPRGWAFHPKWRGVLVRVRPESEHRPPSFKLARGRRVDADVLADLRAFLAGCGVPSRGTVNLRDRLAALARPPRRP